MSHKQRSLQGLDDIYRKLEGGLGHELVDDGNVDELIRMASQQGNKTIEAILIEWKADCRSSGQGATGASTTQGAPDGAHFKR